ncbi:MAG: tRNA lysidine(34) synthetase TilS [Caldisericota bacterium]|nr:tRNA lysidine(34) synthetase TilS [Caldisericota bacterium]
MKKINISNEVKNTIEEFALIKKRERVLVGISGGADSMCLLHILNELKDELGFSIAVATFNHKMRKESEEETKFVSSIAAKLDIPFFYNEKNIKKLAKMRSRSLEDMAREERFAFFLKIKQEEKYDKTALAHTMDDLVETTLIHLLKGTGVTGLIGIRPKSFQGIIHPLIRITRKDVEAYIKLNKIPFRTDWTNFSLDYLRNRVRHQLVPLLASLNPEIKRHILNLSLTLLEEEQFINEISLKDKALLFNKERYSLTIFNALPLFEKRRIIKLMLYKYATFDRIERIVQFLSTEKSNKTNLYGNLYILKNKKEFWIEKTNPLPFTLKKEYPITIPGATSIEKANIIIKTEIIDNVKKSTLDSNKIVVDMDNIPLPLKVRFRKKGDKISLKMGNKKIQDLFVNQKIGVKTRHKVPLLVSSKNEIIWVIGVRRSNLYQITKNTKNKLLLTATLRKTIF